nr:EOG090X04JL [Triops cancriformis]
MSLNKFMHPRNPYKTPPDFRQLAIEYPEFRKYAKQTLAGKILIDYKDPEALRALTTCLLKRDFNLLVELPPDRLVPTLPLRFNYILWIEDLINKAEDVHGIDIGTGASCIYPILVAKKNRWKMLATEKDPLNFEYAEKNVKANKFDSLIQVRKSDDNALLVGRLDPQIVYDFCMCNPPFYTKDKDGELKTKPRRSVRSETQGTPAGSLAETAVEGGEVAFVQRLIDESLQLKDQICIFTTMLGHKSSVDPVKHALESNHIISVTTSEFCQGNTMRWAVAWTFRPDIHFSDTSLFKKTKRKPPLTYIVPPMEKYNLHDIANKIQVTLNSIQVDFTLEKSSKKCLTYNVTAARNTWSHDRRRRRRERSKSESPEKSAQQPKCDADVIDSSDPPTEPPKKHPRLEPEADTKADISYGSHSVALKCSLQIQQAGPTIALHLTWLGGDLGREAVHQVLQYLKNKLNTPTCNNTASTLSYEYVAKTDAK